MGGAGFRDYIRRVPQAVDDWVLYSDHRAHFSAALAASAKGSGGRLCILGAGKCNDCDLEQLLEVFSEIHLVDLEPAALAAATARQSPAVRARLKPHAPVDLAGLPRKRLSKWQQKPPSREELAAHQAATLSSITSRLPGPFDVVASACVLTQMAFALREALGERHPRLAAICGSIVATHLNSLLALTAVGGNCLFSSDLVSSSAYSALQSVTPETDLNALMNSIVDSGASYFAANPKLIRDILSYDLRLAEHAGAPEQLAPWLWTGPLGRTYLVYALRFERIS
jgi:hypothetical protein